MTTTPTSRRASAARRYPALAYLAGAVMLALLLPSGLTLPNRGPSTLAEYAPVPGQGQGQAPIAQLGQASSGGLGAASQANPATTSTLPPSEGSARIVKRAGTKRCVGNPPRQTEDPLSPPCVAFFDGDNGGVTAKGVTKDSITVVLGAEGVGSATEKRKGEIVSCDEPPDQDKDGGYEILCKGMIKYFNERYQTYGRTVHAYVSHVPSADADAKLHPFASDGSPAEKQGTLAIGYSGGRRAAYGPYKYSFRPDYEDAAAQMATFICTKLNGRPARYAGDPLLQQATRKFAMWMRDDDTYRPILQSALKATCNISPTIIGHGASADTNPTAAQLRQQGVTTVLLETGNTDFAVATQEATQQGYFPEWMVTNKPQPRLNDVNFYGRLADQNQWRHAFGVTTDYRRDAPHDQWWYRAYREGCPDCPEPTPTGYSASSFTYDTFTLLFRAIQAAGPRLTVANADKGMHAIPPNGSPDPYKPAAYFSPGNFSYVKDAMAIWWDPSGQAPGQTSPGCYRLIESGRRYRTGEWKAGDDDLFRGGSDAPCQGDPFQA